jgi:hypothetical protein
MTASSRALTLEINELVLEQIFTLKQSVELDDRQLLEYHLRHLLILSLYRQLDRVGWERASGKA